MRINERKLQTNKNKKRNINFKLTIKYYYSTLLAIYRYLKPLYENEK